MKCIRPTQHNILEFLQRQGPHTIEGIQFNLDTHHGCVWSRSRILRALSALVKKGRVITDGERYGFHS